jgi:hypothetical protein
MSTSVSAHATTVTVNLTKIEVQVLRRLIVDEATRLGLNRYQHESEWPSRGKRMRSVSRKIWEARQSFDKTGKVELPN